jgi:hypothetical protein
MRAGINPTKVRRLDPVRGRRLSTPDFLLVCVPTASYAALSLKQQRMELFLII